MKFSLLSVLFFMVAATAAGQVKLHQLFQDHMVIQRSKPVNVWGTAPEGSMLNITLGSETRTASPNAKGQWMTTFPAREAGGSPLTLTVVSGNETLTVSDILVGDVWVCSGQSNMEWRLEQAHNAAQELASERPANLRVFKVDKDVEFKPVDDIRKPARWILASDTAVADFSAVGYFFGKEIQAETGIPVGLIGTSWGGTVAEAWMSAETASMFPEFTSKVEFIRQIDKTTAELSQDGKEEFQTWCNAFYYNDPGFDQQWYLPQTDVSDWKAIQVPGLWEDLLPELAGHDGAVWYRREFDLDPSFTGKDIVMWLSQIDDHNMAWVNGHKLGETFFYNTWVSYTVPDSILKPTGNTLVVRVYDAGGKGGFTGLPSYFDYYPVNDRSKRLSSSGIWKCKAGAVLKPENRPSMVVKEVGPNEFVSLLFNAMIHPLLNFPIKGAIWYQGESNASRAYQYREIFPAMIKDWRKHWNCGDFPFLFVQLANFNSRNEQPVDNDWAELREAQTMTLSLPATGMATIIDLGEANDIHPRNKLDVGKRLALAALNVAYGRELVYSGPVYKSHKIKGATVTLRFDHADSGLKTNDGKHPLGFAIAGPDSIFHWADARIVKNTVVISSAKVSHPIAVRYAWDSNPATNLYNNEGLPAVPFRTDAFKGVTFGIK